MIQYFKAIISVNDFSRADYVISYRNSGGLGLALPIRVPSRCKTIKFELGGFRTWSASV